MAYLKPHLALDLDLSSRFTTYSLVTLGKSLNSSMPQFPYKIERKTVSEKLYEV